ncbi:unnamed protein product [Agarophyton chilense]
MTFTPPPWSDVAHLLQCGCYFYFSFFLLAAIFSYSYAIPLYMQPTLDLIFNRVVRRLDAPYLRVEGTFLGRISRGFALGVLRMFVSTIICILYVYSTYAGYINPTLLICQKVVAVILFFNIFSKLVYATRPVSFVLGFEVIMDVFSLSSLLMAKHTDWLNFSFLQAYVILSRYFQIEPTLEIYFMVKSSPFHRQLTRLALEFIVFIYVFASGLQLFEQLGEPWETLIGTTFDLTLANSFYFTVVTIFTVGYGDFVPFTLLGRLWIIFIIVFGAYLVSRKIGQVVDVVSGLRRGLGSFVKAEATDHCVICGNVKWEYLKAFVLEFYGDDRNAKTKLVIICDQPNWSETVWINFFTSNIHYRDNVTYLEGSCVTRDDLIRAQVETSKAVFILNNQHNPDPYAEDSETLKRILTIRSYTPNLPIYSMCALRDSMLQITFALEHVDENEEAEENADRVSGMNLRSRMVDPSSSEMAGFPSLAEESHPRMGDFDDGDDDDDGLLVTSYDENLSDTASASTDIPFSEGEDHIPMNNRCERAGDILTGDLTVEYQYIDDSENEDDQETQEFSSAQSGEGGDPSFVRSETPGDVGVRDSGSFEAFTQIPPSAGRLPSEAPSSSRGPTQASLPSTIPEEKPISDPIPVLINAIPQSRGPMPSGSIPEQIQNQDRLPLVITRTGSAQHLSSISGRLSTTEGEPDKSGRRSGIAENGESLVMFRTDQELPMRLTGHVVVCTIGRMALQNLGYFLQQVNVERSFSKGKAPVVAICSRLSEEEEADLELYASNSGIRESDRRRSPVESDQHKSDKLEPHQPSLVVIQGNSLSVKTLRRAQFEKAKAVVILACENVNDVDHMDAKAIFTVMTLDYLLGEDSETFVCTMLDAEESMQLLRAPAHPRRRGAVLGRVPEENMELAVTTSNLDKLRRRGPSKPRIGRFGANFKSMRDSSSRFPSRTLSYGAITAGGPVLRSVSFIGDRSLAAETGGYRPFVQGSSQNSFSAREPSANSFGALHRSRGEDDGALMQNPSLAGDSAFRILLGPSANNGLGSTQTLRDEKGKRRAMNGLRHGFRDESFEKQRYASGEMVISSTYVSLLIREFAMPGLIAVVRKIFGATIGRHTKPRRSWIRTVSIPAKWIDNRERTYREVFEVLIGYGAIALGLYRSGNANVRVQFTGGSNLEPSASYSSRTESFGSLPEPNLGASSGSDEEELDLPCQGFPGLRDAMSFREHGEGRNDGSDQRGLLNARARQSSGGYGAIRTQGRYAMDSDFGNSDIGSGEVRDVDDGVHIPPELYRMAESVVSGQGASSEWSGRGYGTESQRNYTCPSSRRTTTYKELPGGDNVLPYVYTNPEAFTLVSDRDAVYVLVSPNVQLPEEW